jgi:DamX protein
MEPMPEEQSPFVDQAAMNESMAVEPIEPMGGAMDEPVEPLPMQPTEITEPEPMAAMAEEPMMSAGMAGDIRSQPPGYFAVQLVASSSMKNLMAFTQRYNLPDQWIAETNVNGKTWFVLLSGVYATREEANAALSDARARLDTGPWIRSVGSLQSVMVP